MTALLETQPTVRSNLFLQKLEQCNVIFDFRDPSVDIKGKEIKRMALQELLEYVTSNRNVLTESMYPKICNMVRKSCLSMNLVLIPNSLQRIFSVLYLPL